VIGDHWVAVIVIRTLLTHPRNYSKTWNKDDPIILGPQDPTAVDKDKFTEEIRDHDEDTGANKIICHVCEFLDACGILQWCSDIA
jgi:hypothetical protein